MRQFRVFGIKSIDINGTAVHTCNVRVANTFENNHICSKFATSLNHRIISTMAGKRTGYRREVSMIEFKLTTTDYEKFQSYTQRLGEVLRMFAQQRLNEKYAWINPPLP
jgi:hypothetical protein